MSNCCFISSLTLSVYEREDGATLRNMHAHCHNKYSEVRQIHNSPHPLVCEFSIDGCFLSPFLPKRIEMSDSVLSEGFLHWSRDTAMCCHPLDNTHPLPSVPPTLPRALLEVTSLTWHITYMWWCWAGMGLRKGYLDCVRVCKTQWIKWRQGWADRRFVSVIKESRIESTVLAGYGGLGRSILRILCFCQFGISNIPDQRGNISLMVT